MARLLPPCILPADDRPEVLSGIPTIAVGIVLGQVLIKRPSFVPAIAVRLVDDFSVMQAP